MCVCTNGVLSLNFPDILSIRANDDINRIDNVEKYQQDFIASRNIDK